jgi:hypothetical protein
VIWQGAPRPAREPLLWLYQRQGPAPAFEGWPISLRGTTAWLHTAPFAYQDAAGVTRQGEEVRLAWWQAGLRVGLLSRALAVADVVRVAEALAPLAEPARVVYCERGVGGWHGARLLTGREEDFPVPSVTAFTDTGVFLLRSQTGWSAFINEDAQRMLTWLIPLPGTRSGRRFVPPCMVRHTTGAATA